MPVGEAVFVGIRGRGGGGLSDGEVVMILSISQPNTIVLSREGYRSLLHGQPNYRDFLKSVMMSRTILYIGFSFTDDYLNEVRSDVMSMKQCVPVPCGLH